MPVRRRAARLAEHLLALAVTASAALAAPTSPAASASPPPPTGVDLPALCEAAAIRAATTTGVPLSVLRAIALGESGRRRGGALRPWPWTVNMEGTGAWFATRDEALTFVYDHYKAGARSFDLGCFQINYRWHGQAFASIDAMFDPDANALYAARFLQGLHAELGDWSLAAGAYHSRTPEHAERYAARFDALRETIAAETPGPVPVPAGPLRPAPAAPQAPAPTNAYPLLLAGAEGRLGSLVPLGDQGARPLFSPAEPQG